MFSSKSGLGGSIFSWLHHRLLHWEIQWHQDEWPVYIVLAFKDCFQAGGFCLLASVSSPKHCWASEKKKKQKNGVCKREVGVQKRFGCQALEIILSCWPGFAAWEVWGTLQDIGLDLPSFTLWVLQRLSGLLCHVCNHYNYWGESSTSGYMGLQTPENPDFSNK